MVDHSVPKELVDSMTRLSRDFFALSAEENLKYDMRGGMYPPGLLGLIHKGLSNTDRSMSLRSLG